MKGVYRTRVGYAGGTTINPTYRSIGDHTETIQMEYNPEEVAYSTLVDVFWNNHCAADRAWSRQYMSILFYHNEEQRLIAEETKKQQEELLKRKLETVIQPYSNFYMAEDYHQKYYLQLHRSIADEYKRCFGDMAAFINSTATARVNGYIKGYGTLDSLMHEISELGLTDHAKNKLFQILEGYGR